MTKVIDFPSLSSLIPHENPMILIDNLMSVDENSIHCQVFVTENSPFFMRESNTVGAWVGIEYMAQTVSAWAGYQSFLKNEPTQIGFLLGARRYNADCSFFSQGDILDIYAEKLMESDGMGAFSCLIKCHDKLLASAQLNVFLPNKKLLKEMLNGTNNDETSVGNRRK